MTSCPSGPKQPCFFNWDLLHCKDVQSLRGIKLQEKEVHKDQSIQKMFRKNLQTKGIQ